MDNCLFLGNGISRCFNELSWDELLNKLAYNNFRSVIKNSLPTLTFEELRNSIEKQQKDFDEELLNILNNIDVDNEECIKIYREFLALDFRNVITTNYDYMIEKALLGDAYADKNKNNLIYSQEHINSVKRHHDIGEKRIFHIHGELQKPKSICLGLTQYVKNMLRIQDLILEKSDDEELKDYLRNIDKYVELTAWADFFFVNNIFFVGFGLAPSEIDIWWLISLRLKFKTKYHDEVVNRIYYYYLYEEEKRDNDFIELLRKMEIEVVDILVSKKDWKNAYLHITKNIKEKIRGQEN